MSLVLTTPQILKKIEKQGYRYAKIFENYVAGNDDDEKAHFERFDCKSAAELLHEIKEFSDEFPGRFTIVMRVNRGGTDKTLCTSHWSTLPETAAVKKTEKEATESGSFSGDMLDKLKTDWMKEMAAQFKINELTYQLQAKDHELNGLKTQGDKLAYVGMQILQGIGFGKGKGAAILQGAQTSEPTDAEITPVQDVEGYKKAMERLHWLLGEETLIKLANKLTPNCSEINLVKSFANS